MVKMFNYLTRSDISRIRCQAHLLHLIICNGLSLWVGRSTMNSSSNNSNDNTNSKDPEERLSQSLKKVNIETFNDDSDSCDSTDEEEADNNFDEAEENSHEVR